ncbi:MAG: hypothetical protein EPO35_01375 [Acidobacteria bacterium]|nr:MAG: hypothetical protein EPO35_01375 [Acidobacteriota bacterium]
MSRRALTLLVTALGVLLLAWQIEKIGLAAIADGVRRMGITGLALILAVSLLRQLLRSAAWVILMRDDARVPISRALAATIAGDAVGNLTPLSLVVSEPAKAMLVRAHMPPQRALAALAAENFFYSLSVAITVLAGVVVLFVAFPVPEALRTASLVLVGLMAAVLVGALWLIWKEPALVSSTLSRFTGFAGAKAPAYEKFVDKIRELETSSYAFVRSKPGRLAGVVLCEAAFHVLSVAETWITLYFLGITSLALAFVLDTVQRVINVVFRVVPLKIGVDEVGSGLTSAALGYGSALGVTMGVIRKIRVLFWALVGLLLVGRR